MCVRVYACVNFLQDEQSSEIARREREKDVFAFHHKKTFELLGTKKSCTWSFQLMMQFDNLAEDLDFDLNSNLDSGLNSDLNAKP